MKKFAFTLFASVLGIVIHAQTMENVNLFNTSGVYGSPRYTAMGGAFMALGNDLSSMSINPAGAAVYRYDNFGMALRFQGQNNSSTFLGRESDFSTFNLIFENIGLVKKFGPKNKMSFGFSYNKLADFNSEFQVAGINRYRNFNGIESGFTLGEYWLAGAYGQTVSELEVAGLLEEASAASADILLTDSNGVVIAFDAVDDAANVQYNFDERGRRDEYTFNLAGAENDIFYWGIGIGIPTLHYDNTTTLSESGYADSSYFRSIELVRQNSVDAIGFNMKAGFIFRPFQALRIAASYQSPSWYNVNEVYTTSAVGFGRDGSVLNGIEYVFDDIRYGLSTPAIYRAGVGLVMGKVGILSADVEYTDPSKSTINGKNNNNYESDEALYQSETTETLTVKFGGELRAGKLFFRGGYQYRMSNYKNYDPVETPDIYFGSSFNAYSGGIGYKNGDFSVNLSYIHSVYSQQYYTHPYLAYEVNNGNGEENANPNRSILTNDVSKGSVLVGFNVSF